MRSAEVARSVISGPPIGRAKAGAKDHRFLSYPRGLHHKRFAQGVQRVCVGTGVAATFVPALFIVRFSLSADALRHPQRE
jgi:hypothetical protein